MKDELVTEIWNQQNGTKRVAILLCKQEAHGPHRSDEKPVLINKNIWEEFYI